MTQRIRALARIGAASLLLLLAVGCGGPKPHPIVVGAVEDAAKNSDPAAAMDLAQRAGFRAIALSATWTPPASTLDEAQLAQLRGAARAAAAVGIKPIVSVYSFSGVTPLTDEARGQFASFAASIPRAIPEVRDVVVGNEPNLNLFWMPQFAADGSDAAAPAYLALLARTYDALKAVDPKINVIGGALASRGSDNPDGKRPTHSPTRFIEHLGAAYRASGRTEPVMDMFSLHPYPDTYSIPPTLQHPKTTTIGIADYDKLTKLLDDAFGKAPPIMYGEYGIETEVPPAHAGAYTGREPVEVVDTATQARHYVQAIRLAACQPLVRMLLFFHVTDEWRLEGLQSGLFYADGTPKPSLAQVASAARDAHEGRLECLS
jgi:sugar phosphate isomerase/epimerase